MSHHQSPVLVLNLDRDKLFAATEIDDSEALQLALQHDVNVNAIYSYELPLMNAGYESREPITSLHAFGRRRTHNGEI